MNEDTKKLLEECNSGCKMAIQNMDHVYESINVSNLKSVIDHYKSKHEEIEKTTANLLCRSGNEEKDPPTSATVFSWVNTEMKLMMKDDKHEIAKLMMDGCNMGIQSICKFQNQYSAASNEAKNIATELIQMEEDFMRDLKAFL